MSEIKVNKISPRSGTTVTLGDSGDTFTIPSGATINNQGTATNFGATGSASWVTSSIKTSTFTATAGEGYFCNTTGGAFTVNLPAGSAGAVVAVKDYANTFDSNNLTIAANGSEKIGGSTDDVILSEEGIAITLVFIDSTQGWLVTDSGLQSEASQVTFITATGGTITTSGNDKIHTFTGPGTFTVCSVGSCAANNQVSYLVVAGGGGAGECRAGGGGAGGFREDKSPITPYTASPLEGAGAITVTATGFPIAVGSGGAGSTSNSSKGTQGNVSTFSTITSTGGGGGASDAAAPGAHDGGPGGSGGGAANGGTAGSGNTPPVSPSQGNNGGGSPSGYVGAGGGGATAVGTTAGAPGTTGNGGAGATTNITGSPVAYAGGGGGGGFEPEPGTPAGSGGAGGGGDGTLPGASTGGAGTANTGGGGGGNGGPPGVGAGGAGGSGVVIIRYRYQ